MDEGDDGVNFQLQRRLGLHGLLGTLLVPQPCGGVRCDLLSHLQYSSFLLHFSLSLIPLLNFLLVRACCLKSRGARGVGWTSEGADWWSEQQGSRACSGAPFYARGLSNGRSGHVRISPGKEGGRGFKRQWRHSSWSIRWGTVARGLRRSQGRHRPTAGDVGDGVAPACSGLVALTADRGVGGPGRRLRRARPRSAARASWASWRGGRRAGFSRRHGAGGWGIWSPSATERGERE